MKFQFDAIYTATYYVAQTVNQSPKVLYIILENYNQVSISAATTKISTAVNGRIISIMLMLSLLKYASIVSKYTHQT